MIQKGDLIRHKRIPETVIQVVTVTMDPETHNLLVKGIWLDQNQPNGNAECFIRPEDRKNWYMSKPFSQGWRVLG